MKNEKIWWKRLIIIVLVSVIGGILFETLYEANIRHKIKNGGYQCILEKIPEELIQLEGGIKNQEIYTVDQEGTVTLSFDGRYVNKLQYRYEAKEDFGAQVIVEKQNLYGEYMTEIIRDDSKSNLKQSVININGNVRTVSIKFESPCEIFDLEINNIADKNGYRILYVTVFLALILFIFLFRKKIGRQVEYGFLAVSLALGILLIAVQPTQFMCWDEHIHFMNSYEFFKSGQREWEQNEYYQYFNWERFEPKPFVSKEEKAMQIHYLNHSNHPSGYMQEKGGFSINQLGYLHIAVVMQTAKAIGIPFYYVMLLGKMANLFLYVMLVFFAIKVIPVYKRMLTAVALMPTPMILATAFSYDAAVNAFLILGSALLIREFYEKEKKSKPGILALMLFCFLFGSCSKAIYIPLVLGVLFLPASKFESKRKQNIWRGITIVGCVLLVGSFMLPVLTGSMEADARGGNTDVAMQLSLILKHPVAYVKILWRALYGSFNDYVLGKDSFAHMAFMGIHRYYLMVTVLLTAVFFTEPRKIMSGETKKSLAIYKITALILSAGIVVMIWTALYLAYTEVGSMHIAGVQARYYIPLTIPVLTVLYTDKVSARWKDQNYNSVIFLCVLLIWHLTLYTDYLTRFCA